ncbi:hypothetical protein SAMN04487866_10237 [Thermoactinomyces sp. DSM 45891]|uniref:hypothetical protein n=1 Tax=Thermoactinomyces sp. DSM 45891 TaxID=1761907 RepID=UPI000919FDFD|nr:hypothetical protein [Thermoactinomyces sp. DSM 45891]SFX18042.1 hypothetical protein SAMN04487866_10237 [Thermoactinomyces sp. DSM 45891]
MNIHKDSGHVQQPFQNQHKAPMFSLEHTIDLIDRIQKAYESNSPILLVYRTPFGHRQFCGFVDRIEPDERTIHLFNGSIKRKIDLTTMVTLELV